MNASNPNNVTIIAVGPNGPKTSGGDKFNATLDGVQLNVTDNGDGTYTIIIKPTAPGENPEKELNVTLIGIPLLNCPLPITSIL